MSIYGDLTSAKTIKDGNPASAERAPRESRGVPRQQGGHVAWSGYSVPSATGLMTETGAQLQPAGYPYWWMLLWGCEPVYRLMLQHDTIALARYVVTGPVRASSWDMTWDDSISKDDPAVRWVKDNILPLRRNVIREAIRAVDFGWQPFAVIWEIRDGMYVPNLEPLLPDATTVLQKKGTNRFAGLENRGEGSNTPTLFNDLESWAPSLDGEAGYPYGRSRLENLRTTAWAPWLEAYMRAKQLTEKISGIVPIVTHPPNGYVDDAGVAINYAAEADKLLNELPHGRGVRLEGALDPREIIANTPEFADKLSQVKVFDVDFLDAGNVAPAVSGFIALLEYYDKKLFRGMLRPERAGLEAVAAGSRADSEQHTETGAADSEAIDADLTGSFDEHVVRTALRLNFGEEKARRIHVISTPLLKWKQQVFREVISRLVSNPDIAISTAKTLDMDGMFGQLSLPQIKAFVFEAIEKNPAPPAESGVNGNTNGNERLKAEQLAEVLHAWFSQHQPHQPH